MYCAVPVLPYTGLGKLPITSLEVPPALSGLVQAGLDRVSGTSGLMCRWRSAGNESFCSTVPSALWMSSAEVRVDDRAAVRDRRVDHRELQRRDLSSPWPTAGLMLSPTVHATLGVPRPHPPALSGCFGERW